MYRISYVIHAFTMRPHFRESESKSKGNKYLYFLDLIELKSDYSI
jgi:hypothetical protein